MPRSNVVWTPERRAAFSAQMKRRMADPVTRARISEGTKLAAMSDTGEVDEMRLLRAAWHTARASARQRFLKEIFSPVCSASASQPLDRNEAQ